MFGVTNHDAFRATVVEHKLSDVQAVYGPDGVTIIAYSGARALRKLSGCMTQVFDVITLDGRYVGRGYKSRGPVTSWVRKNLDLVASVVEETAETPAPEREEPAADVAESSAQVLAGMPRNAGVNFHEAVETQVYAECAAAESEAYAAVMAECRAQHDTVSRVWAVDRTEREDVPHGNAHAREVAESATADMQPLMSRAAEAEGTAGGAAMVRAEILPALLMAREAVEVYDAHRSEEARAHAMREAADQGAPVAVNTDHGELPPPATCDDALAPVDAAPLRAYMFNAGAAGLWVHVSGPRDAHVGAAEHVATTASVEALKVEALTDADADAALVAAGWERCGEWDGDRSAPVQRAAPVAEAAPVRLALPAAPVRLAIEAAPVAVLGSVAADLEAGAAARVVAGLGWSREFADVVRTAAAGHLLPEDGGKFRALGSVGRRGKPVKAERVRLLLGAGYLALDSSGLLVATADGIEALRMVDLAPEALQPEADVMAAVRKARRARQWDSKEGQDANALPVLPGGGEEARRRAAARKSMERWEKRAEESRKESERIRARARIQERRERQAAEKRRAEESAPCRECRGVYPVEARCGRCRERAALGLPLVDFLALPAASVRAVADVASDLAGLEGEGQPCA